MAVSDHDRKFTCSVIECDSKVLALGFCPKHYYRFKKRGSTEMPPKIEKVCCVVGCLGSVRSKLLCNKHYQCLRLHGVAEHERKKRARCSFPECGKPAKGKGYCAKHYQRVNLHGDPNIGKAEARALKAVPSVCIQCSLPIRKNHERHRFCSERCSKWHRAGKAPTTDCMVCKKPFIPNHGIKVCSEDCEATRARDQARQFKQKQMATENGRAANAAANRRYASRHRERVNAATRRRRKECPEFKVSIWMRSVLHKCLIRANLRKNARTVKLLGFNREALRVHIERQFVDGMSWSNHGEWHIDHIIPVAHFIRKGEKDPAVINALSNLRPLWALENIRKSDQLIS